MQHFSTVALDTYRQPQSHVNGYLNRRNKVQTVDFSLLALAGSADGLVVNLLNEIILDIHVGKASELKGANLWDPPRELKTPRRISFADPLRIEGSPLTSPIVAVALKPDVIPLNSAAKNLMTKYADGRVRHLPLYLVRQSDNKLKEIASGLRRTGSS